MFFMPPCVQLFWSHFSHFLESPIWFSTLCLKFILAPVSSFRRDITFTTSGAYLKVFRTKSIQFKQSPPPVISNSILCPVTALRSYFKLVPAASDSPVFLAPHCFSFTPVLAQHLNLFLKRCVSFIGKDRSHFSSCSFKKGVPRSHRIH